MSNFSPCLILFEFTSAFGLSQISVLLGSAAPCAVGLGRAIAVTGAKVDGATGCGATVGEVAAVGVGAEVVSIAAAPAQADMAAQSAAQI